MPACAAVISLVDCVPKNDIFASEHLFIALKWNCLSFFYRYGVYYIHYMNRTSGHHSSPRQVIAVPMQGVVVNINGMGAVYSLTIQPANEASTQHEVNRIFINLSFRHFRFLFYSFMICIFWVLLRHIWFIASKAMLHEWGGNLSGIRLWQTRFYF